MTADVLSIHASIVGGRIAGVSCKLIMDKVTSQSKGFAFVEMGSVAEATKALADFNGKELDGRALKVNEAKPCEDRPPR